MTISGKFKNYNNVDCEVIITTNNQGNDIVIGGDTVKFSANPVEIEESVDDSFQIFIKKSATINLVTKTFLGDVLFAENARSSTVIIKVNDVVVFNGYINPNTYNQPFTSPWDEFTINCIDKLSTLQYYNYKNANINNFDTLKNAATNVTFKSIIDDSLSDLNFGAIYYDRSKGLTSTTASANAIFNNLVISELNIYGETIDDVWTKEETLEEILKYLNLHIKQEGNDIYIFDWQSIKNKLTSWRNIKANTSKTISASTVNMLNTMHSDRNTNISIDDVYNQIVLTCDIEAQDTVVESPLDKTYLTSLYSGKQLYMTEYIAEGKGVRANNAINNMINGLPVNPSDIEAVKPKEIDWYIQAMTNPYWKFYIDGSNVVESLSEKNSDGVYINQWKLAKYLHENSLTPYIFNFGYVEHEPSAQDNSPVSKIDMKPYLYISVNGNERDTEQLHEPTDNYIYAHRNMCEFVGNTAGGSFSPTDDDTTNYLVFSGKILLQPIVYESTTAVAGRGNYFEQCRTNGVDKLEIDAQVPRYDWVEYITSNCVKSENNEDGRYYSRKFYSIENPKDKTKPYLTDGTCGVQPWTQDKSAAGYQYNYTENWDSTDRYSKLPILECELIIGNKRLIETNIDIYGNSTFEWVELGQEPTETVDGVTYTITTFTLGFNPKIGDKIIGTEFPIQNTIDYTMNLDEEGTAIPIKKSDNINGSVIFRIVGTINLTWDNVTRRHPSFWRHTQWTTNTKFILAHTENIIIQDFECKICTDSGQNTIYGDKDLIYMSDETQNFITKKDDIDFKFITQLSSEECLQKGIQQSVNLNSVINGSTNLPLTGIYNKYETNNSYKIAKAEEHYINQYYLEYCQPKIKLETELHTENCDWRNIYNSSALSKQFYVQSKSDNIRECTSKLILKEI